MRLYLIIYYVVLPPPPSLVLFFSYFRLVSLATVVSRKSSGTYQNHESIKTADDFTDLFVSIMYDAGHAFVRPRSEFYFCLSPTPYDQYTRSVAIHNLPKKSLLFKPLHMFLFFIIIISFVFLSTGNIICNDSIHTV